MVSAADPIARNVPGSYTAPTTSATFGTTEMVKVVQTSAGAPVVVHRVYSAARPVGQDGQRVDGRMRWAAAASMDECGGRPLRRMFC